MSESSCCHSPAPDPKQGHGDSCHDHSRVDWLFWGSSAVLAMSILAAAMPESWLPDIPYLVTFITAEWELVQDMWLGMFIGVFSIGLMNLLPKDTILNALGRQRGVGSVLRAAAAGIVLDLCNHGLLLIAGKLYKSGVRYSQVLAFLIASPWNSLSLTIVMFALLGWAWTLTFIGLSFLVAVVAGLIVDGMESRGSIEENPFRAETERAEKISVKDNVRRIRRERGLFRTVCLDSFSESKMIMRWLLFGMVLAALIKTFVSQDAMQTWFGPTLVGLGLTLVAATVIEVCSEGLLPIAADLLTRAAAPGNAFTFMMAGVSTDYTEIMVLKETTGRWKMAFVLPLVTLPQILLLGVLLNQFSA
ncbi:permease [Ketobacter alkanivorans]|uniref:ATPase n=1 Tax=Ketobacter alkanivorans TaxID=1917421 RepID=A0A2K9LL53_9GAMM|nr:permease [Ketobacter alkanivorans]AUM12990.1 hypothetical protein Kalk_11390 [Ketobacter alkanivorans]